MDPCRRTNRVLRTFSSADIAGWGNNQFRIPFSWLSFCRNPRDSLQLICSRCNTVQTRHSGAQRGGSGNDQSLGQDRKSTRLNSSHLVISYAVFCLKKKKKIQYRKNIQCSRDSISSRNLC